MQNHDLTIQKARELAQSEDGRKLFEILQQMGDSDLSTAAEKAAAGDFSQVQQTVSRLLEIPEARNLLEKWGGIFGKYGG